MFPSVHVRILLSKCSNLSRSILHYYYQVNIASSPDVLNIKLLLNIKYRILTTMITTYQAGR